MKRTVYPFLSLFFVCVGPDVTHAKSLIVEITPQKLQGWTVKVKPMEKRVEFTVYHASMDGRLPKNTTAQLVIRKGKQIVAIANLGLEKERKSYCFRFTVDKDFLKDSRFELRHSFAPLPSMDIYWFSLRKFYDASKESN